MTQSCEVPGVISPRKVPSHLCNLGRSWGRLCPHLQAGVLGFLSLGVGQCECLLVLAAHASRSYLGKYPLLSKTSKSRGALGGAAWELGWGTS